MTSGPITSLQIEREKVERVTDFIFLGSKITVEGVCSHEIKTLASWKKSYNKPTQCIKRQRHFFAFKGPSSQSYDFSSSQVQMWELDHKEDRAPKNWCFWTVVLEESWESLGMQGKQTSQSWRKSPWIFIGRTDVEAVAPILWPPDMKIWLIGKDPDAGKDWRQEEKWMTEDEMVGWHHWLNGREFQ